MPRIAGVDIPPNKRIIISLTYIYGVGRPLAEKLLKDAKIDKNIKAKDLAEAEINYLRQAIEKEHTIEGELKREILTDIKRLKEIRSWRGMRHTKGLPVRGQKTKKNSRTVRGNVRRTVSSGRKDAPGPK